MIDLDGLVHDPRFLPYYGWYDDHLDKGDMAVPAIQQHRAEFLEFVLTLSKLGILNKCLQLGLGTPGASHFVFGHLFSEAWTLDISEEAVASYLGRVPDLRLVVGDTQAKPQKIFEQAPFDLLFIDAGHRYEEVSADFYTYEPLVHSGGIVAFHDTVPCPEREPHVAVWRFVEELQKQYAIVRIGTQLGISYFVKP